MPLVPGHVRHVLVIGFGGLAVRSQVPHVLVIRFGGLAVRRQVQIDVRAFRCGALVLGSGARPFRAWVEAVRRILVLAVGETVALPAVMSAMSMSAVVLAGHGVIPSET